MIVDTINFERKIVTRILETSNRIGQIIMKYGLGQFLKVVESIENVGDKIFLKINGVFEKIELDVKMMTQAFRDCGMPETEAITKVACIKSACFTADTLVLTDKGHVRIDQIKI